MSLSTARRINPDRPSLLLALALAVGAGDLARLLAIGAALAFALRTIDQASGGTRGTFHGHTILKLELSSRCWDRSANCRRVRPCSNTPILPQLKVFDHAKGLRSTPKGSTNSISECIRGHFIEASNHTAFRCADGYSTVVGKVES